MTYHLFLYNCVKDSINTTMNTPHMQNAILIIILRDYSNQYREYLTVGRIIFEDIKFRGYTKFHFK